MAQSFDQWWASFGLITKSCIALLLGVTLATTFGVVNVYNLLLTDAAIYSLQLWRFVTAAFFFGGFSFQWVMSVMSFISFLHMNEESAYFKGKPADFLWALLFIILTAGVAGIYLSLPVTSSCLFVALCWLYCKRHPDARMNLFGFEFRAPMFPWALIAVNTLLAGGDLFGNLLGVVIGHLYVFLADVVPQTQGKHPLQTPQWFIRKVNGLLGQYQPQHRQGVFSTNFGGAARGAASGTTPSSSSSSPSSHNWGKGHKLGA